MSTSSGYLNIEQVLKQTWNTDTYDERLAYLRRHVPTWFKIERYVGGGGSILLHIASGGLPDSRHPNPEAAQLQTQSAKRRLQKYQELIELISYGLGVSVCLPELSSQDLSWFRTSSLLLSVAESKSFLQHTSFMSQDIFSMIDYHREWNPVLRLDKEGKIFAESMWEESIERKFVSGRVIKIFTTLQEKRKEVTCPVTVIYTEGVHNFLPFLNSWNAPYLMARQTEKVVEYIKITELW